MTTVPPRPVSLRDRIRSVVMAALWELRRVEAKISARRFVGRYVAITGSCGKTTTAALAGALLGQYGSSALGDIIQNTNLSLFRTVRKLRRRVDFLVQEVSGHPIGNIEVATSTFSIDAAVITSIGTDHRTSFRSTDEDVRDAIALEKGKLVEAVAQGGIACLNFDDPRVRAMASRTGARTVSFGVAPDAEVRAVNVQTRWPNRLQFDLVVGDAVYPVITRFVGSMMLTNILGALAVVHGFGFDLAPAVVALAAIEPVQDRMGVHDGKDGKTYILDTFKAPYWSTELLLDDLERIAVEGLIFVLGDVSDIRGNSSKDYRKLVRIACGRAETVVLVGLAAQYAGRLQKEGFENIVVAPTALDVSRYLDTRPPGSVVMLKATKVSELWRVPEQVAPMAGMSAA